MSCVLQLQIQNKRKYDDDDDDDGYCTLFAIVLETWALLTPIKPKTTRKPLKRV